MDAGGGKRMSDLPWVRFFPSDWLAGTRGMTATETGIYITLIASMYERGEPLPEDMGRLARLCGASIAVFKATLIMLVDEGKIIRVEGGLWNNRVGRESDLRDEKSEVARQNAKSRWSRSNRKTQQKQSQENADALRTQCQNDAIQKPETRYQSIGSSEPIKKDSTSRSEQEAVPERADARKKDRYAFSGKVINLTQSDFDQWARSYSHLDIRAELQARDAWLEANAPPEQRKKWFVSTSKYLANRNAEQRAINQARAGPARQETFGGVQIEMAD